ncbi:MAG TPA: alpha/beta hydrolase family protein [Pirellulales bacterium]|jgi:S-formylglutathione hydrolase FrmB
MLRHFVIPTLAWVSLLAGSAPAAEPLPVKTVEHKADSVGRNMKYNIVLPANYETSTERYPVLYLLHGLTSNYTAWAFMKVPEVAASYKLIIVMPDVGNSWYVNWAESAAGQKNQWEDYIIKELIGHVDETYRTIAKREARAINGLSMGGYGAIMLGLRHPDLFCSIGSHSGALAFADRSAESVAQGEQPEFLRRPWTGEVNPKIKIEGFSSPAERTPQGKIFLTREQCDAHDPFKLVLAVERAKLPYIYVDCGTDDGLITSNQRFCRLLMENNIPFTYGQSRGGHVPPYWAREVAQSIAVQNLIIERSLAQAAKSAKSAADAAGN